MQTEFKVLTVVVLAMLSIEFTIRAVERDLSLDVDHIRSIPEVAEEIRVAEDVRTPGGRKMRILFLGNSLTRRAVDPKAFEEFLAAAGFDVSTYFVYPDASSVTEWSQAYKTYFADKGIRPDLVIVPFGKSHLRDGAVDPTISSAFLNLGGIVEMPTIDEKAEFALARASAAFAHRRRVAPRVLTLVIPHYQEGMREVYGGVAVKAYAESIGRKFTFERFVQFLGMLSAEEVKSIFVAVPMPESYDLPDNVIRPLGGEGADLVDLRELDGLRVADFPDGYHLGEHGAALFTKALSEAVATLIGRRAP